MLSGTFIFLPISSYSPLPLLPAIPPCWGGVFDYCSGLLKYFENIMVHFKSNLIFSLIMNLK